MTALPNIAFSEVKSKRANQNAKIFNFRLYFLHKRSLLSFITANPILLKSAINS